jgi:hypothetical protein
MGGLLVATVLTLLVVPALYALWFRVKQDEGVAAEDFVHEGRFDPKAEPMPIAAE